MKEREMVTLLGERIDLTVRNLGAELSILRPKTSRRVGNPNERRLSVILENQAVIMEALMVLLKKEGK